LRKRLRFLSLIVFAMTLLATTFPGFSQRMFLRRPFDKGSLIGSGSFSYSRSGGELYAEDGNRENRLSFNPSVSYFVTSGLALGLRASISYFSRGDMSYTSLGAGPEVSYYLRKRGSDPRAPIAKGTLVPFVSAGLVFVGSSGNVDTKWGPYQYRYNGTTFDLGLGCLFMLSTNYAVFLNASYEFVRNKQTSGDVRTGNRFLLSAGLSVFGR